MVVLHGISSMESKAIPVPRPKHDDPHAIPVADHIPGDPAGLCWELETEVPMIQTKTLEQVMTKHPLCIEETDSLQKASDLMLQRRIRHLPVTDSRGDVIGVLSERDIQRGMVVRTVNGEAERVLSPQRKVREYMSWPPRTVDLGTPLQEVIQILIEEKISALLVESKLTGKIRGIVTTEDILREFWHMVRRDNPPL